jgi:acetyl-CoA carboxylase carboxyltransferase component
MDPGRQRLESEREAIRTFEARRPRVEGVLSPRERIQALVDPGSFLELGSLTRSQQQSDDGGSTPADGLVAGWATVHGREIALLAEDPLVLQVTDAQVAGDKRLRILNTSAIRGVPIVYLADGQEGEWAGFPVDRGDLFGHHRYQRTEPVSSDLAAPLIVAILGRCVGRAAELMMEADFVVSTRQGSLSIVPGELMSAPGDQDGLFDLLVEDDCAAVDSVRRFLSSTPSVDDPRALVPARTPRRPLDDSLLSHASVDVVIDGLFDEGSILRFHAEPGFVSGIGAIDGHQVAFAVTGGQTAHTLDTLDVIAIGRVAHLSRRLRMPLVFVQDTDGYDPVAARSPEFLRQLAVALDEVRKTWAPKLVLVTGHGHVLGSFVMGGRQLGMDYVMALPFAQVAPRDIVTFHPGAIPDDLVDGPWVAAGFGLLDEVVAPSEARQQLATFLKILSHGLGVPPPEIEQRGRYVADIPKV